MSCNHPRMLYNKTVSPFPQIFHVFFVLFGLLHINIVTFEFSGDRCPVSHAGESEERQGDLHQLLVQLGGQL